MEATRRGFLTGLLALAAPAIIRTPGLLMPLSAAKPGLLIGQTIRIRLPNDWRAIVQPDVANNIQFTLDQFIVSAQLNQDDA